MWVALTLPCIFSLAAESGKDMRYTTAGTIRTRFGSLSLVAFVRESTTVALVAIYLLLRQHHPLPKSYPSRLEYLFESLFSCSITGRRAISGFRKPGPSQYASINFHQRNGYYNGRSKNPALTQSDGSCFELIRFVSSTILDLPSQYLL